MEELDVKFVNTYTVSAKYTWNPYVPEPSNDSNIVILKLNGVVSVHDYYASKEKPNKFLVYLDKTLADKRAHELRNEKIENYDVHVTQECHTGYTCDNGKTVNVIGILNKHDVVAA